MLTRRIAFFCIGLFILALGISLMIMADIGAGAWDALNVGLSETVGLTVGNWVMIVGILVMFVNALLLRARPVFLSIGTIILIGFFIDFWLLIALDEWNLEGFVVKVLTFLGGLVVASLGIAIYLQAKFPLSPLDNFMLAISSRFKLKFGISKTIAEATGLILALLVGGPIGIGTLVVTFGIGPIIQFFFPYCERLMEKGLRGSRGNGLKSIEPK
ncbi:membrane protein [Fredinandcohnia sp. QZ13]|uniref:YczE/YyaS/YitT family protein n=1 Tax=Fredinandcohnia sp. QZ13 TaxID=3073144 RepID=UPI0028533EAE|nr:membrane protein [Fredinandcohnia sp. QZ13]MDR4887915.1 membrane protein [Fredinandcohnia sp. QZ13]